MGQLSRIRGPSASPEPERETVGRHRASIDAAAPTRGLGDAGRRPRRGKNARARLRSPAAREKIYARYWSHLEARCQTGDRDAQARWRALDGQKHSDSVFAYTTTTLPEIL
jgi:hypothetical protein